MRHDTPAMHGKRQLGRPRQHPSWTDAIDSTQLVGSPTQITPGSVRETKQLLAAGNDPISAARAWFADPDRRAAWTDQLIADIELSLELASTHVQELDLMARELVRDAGLHEDAGAGRLQTIDAMAQQLREFSEQMRTLLDPATVDVHEAEQRLRLGVAAGRRGGLGALVASL